MELFSEYPREKKIKFFEEKNYPIIKSVPQPFFCQITLHFGNFPTSLNISKGLDLWNWLSKNIPISALLEISSVHNSALETLYPPLPCIFWTLWTLGFRVCVAIYTTPMHIEQIAIEWSRANKLHSGLIWTINCSDLGHRKLLLFYPCIKCLTSYSSSYFSTQIGL